MLANSFSHSYYSDSPTKFVEEIENVFFDKNTTLSKTLKSNGTKTNSSELGTYSVSEIEDNFIKIVPMITDKIDSVKENSILNPSTTLNVLEDSDDSGDEIPSVKLELKQDDKEQAKDFFKDKKVIIVISVLVVAVFVFMIIRKKR